MTIKDVGSCATLIADLILNGCDKLSTDEQQQLLYPLHATILLDTINLSPDANKAKPLDIDVIAKIEKIINFQSNERINLYNELIEARRDIQSLTSLQLLSKDLKIISNENNSIIVGIPGFPLLVQVMTSCSSVTENGNQFYRFSFYRNSLSETMHGMLSRHLHKNIIVM